MNENPVDILCFFQAKMFPRPAGIERFVDTVAIGLAISRISFSGPDVDDAGIFLIDRYRANGSNRLVVKDRIPADTATRGLLQHT